MGSFDVFPFLSAFNFLTKFLSGSRYFPACLCAPYFMHLCSSTSYTDMPSRMALQASKLYSNNAVKFLLALGDAKDEIVVNMEDQVSHIVIF